MTAEIPDYFGELCRAMEMLADDPRIVFMGQAVAAPGTAMYRTLQGVDPALRVELPVAEDMQLGMAIGASLAGVVPVTIYPRWNFLLLATNQLVLHLDKLEGYSRGAFRPKVIIRTAVATPEPLDPGEQHLGDFTSHFTCMLKRVAVERLLIPEQIVPAYQRALASERSTLLVEYTRSYAQ